MIAIRRRRRQTAESSSVLPDGLFLLERDGCTICSTDVEIAVGWSGGGVGGWYTKHSASNTDTTDTEHSTFTRTENEHTALVFPRSTTMDRPECTDGWSTSQRSGCRSCCMVGCDHPKSVQITACRTRTHPQRAGFHPMGAQRFLCGQLTKHVCATSIGSRITRIRRTKPTCGVEVYAAHQHGFDALLGFSTVVIIVDSRCCAAAIEQHI